MKKTKIIVPALGLLLLSTAASVTGTVAWFSANTDVDITGMEFRTQVSGNILIARNNVEEEYSSNDLVYNPNSEAEGGVDDGILQPVSSVDGVDFYYTKKNVKGNGDIDSDNYYTFETFDTNENLTKYYFGDDSTDSAVAYLDYDFCLMATANDDGDEVYIDICNLLYNEAALDAKDTAWRVAIFVEKLDKNETKTADLADAGNLLTVLGCSGSDYFSATGRDGAVLTPGTPATDDAGTDYEAPTFGISEKYGAVAKIGTIEAKGTTQRYHVVTRLWLEGCDINCNNDTYAPLEDSYQFNLNVKLKQPATSPAVNGVKLIGSDTTKVAK